jgi:hypothetical protein
MCKGVRWFSESSLLVLLLLFPIQPRAQATEQLAVPLQLRCYARQQPGVVGAGLGCFQVGDDLLYRSNSGFVAAGRTFGKLT